MGLWSPTPPIPLGQRVTLVRNSLEDCPRDPRIPGFPIFTALEKDLKGISSILNQSFPDRAFSAEAVRKSIIGPAYAFCTFVALDVGGVVAGTASARRRYGIGEVAWVATHPDYRRRGIATALVQFTVNYLRESGFTEACAVLGPSTSESIAFWAALGFDHYRPDLK